MRLPFLFNLTLAAVLLLAAPGMQGEAAHNYKHSYSRWSYHSKYKYYWRQYHYKDNHHHYAIYHPSRGKRVYYYNPGKKRYWGYYDMENKGYSLLPEKWRLESLTEIPAEAFPKPSREMPLIPGEEIQFEPPTDKLPELAPPER